MNVVFNPSNLDRVTVQVLEGACHVGVNLIPNRLGA